jgi:hypothetical protein
MMFVGRKRELDGLNKQYESGKFEMTIIYGRRRVGKTTLIKEFIKEKNAVYFLSTNASGDMNLKIFAEQLIRHFDPGLENASFPDFDAAFQYLSRKSEDERMVLVIDEYPYLAESIEGMSSILQRAIDEYFAKGKLFIILCGSSMSFMENQVLNQKSPLYGRRTSQIRLQPFTFQETLYMLDGMDPEEVAVYYGVTGGVAEYLSFIRKDWSLKENLVNLFFDTRGRLYEEPKNLLNQELREPKVYNDILFAIANGASRNNEISTVVGKQSSAVNPYLNNLQELHIITKESSITKFGSVKSIYRINDAMYRFWFRFVRKGMANIEMGQGREYYDIKVAPFISEYMGPVFELIVQEYMLLKNRGNKPQDYITEQGRFWGTDPNRKKEVEIDYLGITESAYLIGEAKWTSEPIGYSEFEKLKEKAELIPGQHYYFLFSKSGYTKSFVRSKSNVKLVSFADMAIDFLKI